MNAFVQTLCVILSITVVKARPQQHLGEAEYYPYDIDLSQLEDGLIDPAREVPDKVLFQHITKKWKTSTTATDYLAEQSSTKAVSILPETTTATPTTFEKDSANGKNHENPNVFPMVTYPTPAFQQPMYGYYPVYYFNLLPHMRVVTQNISGVAQPVAGFQAVTHVAVIPQVTHNMFDITAIPYVTPYKPLPFSLQFASPVYNSQHSLNK